MRQFINRILKSLRLIASNPVAFLNIIKPYLFQAKSGLIKINGVNFSIDVELDPAMRKMYFGSYEYELTNTMKKFLKEGDTFIDIGANVGYISAFALGLVGKTGAVHSFEPVPKYFECLKKVKKDNPDYNIFINDAAVGEIEGTSKIAVTNLRNIGWNTMVPNFMEKSTISEEIEIKVLRLSDYLKTNYVKNLSLIKIDTEGFEFPVMKGLKEYLLGAKILPNIIIEIAPGAYPHLNNSLSEFAQFMKELGYVSKSINCKKPINAAALNKTTDVVFVPKNN
jgi:FkbM family methyltransferase